MPVASGTSHKSLVLWDFKAKLGAYTHCILGNQIVLLFDLKTTSFKGATSKYFEWHFFEVENRLLIKGNFKIIFLPRVE